MNIHKSGSGQDLVYKDHSDSGIGASSPQTSAEPTSLASLMRQGLLFIKPPEITDQPPQGLPDDAALGEKEEKQQ